MVTMQVGSYFPNITNKVKKKLCGACVLFEYLQVDSLHCSLIPSPKIGKTDVNTKSRYQL